MADNLCVLAAGVLCRRFLVSDQIAVFHRHCLLVDFHKALTVPTLVSMLLLSLARLQSVGLVLSTAVVLSHSVAESTLAAVRY